MAPNFEKAQSLATALLLKQRFSNLKIDVREFVFDLNITIDTIQHYASVVGKDVSDFSCDEISGCCVVKLRGEVHIILYDDRESNEERKHWGIVHEVGHIYMEHNSDDRISEIEASFFAAQIVMPEIVLYKFSEIHGKITVYDIMEVFNASFTSAGKRIDTFNKRGVYSSNEDDMELLRKMQYLLPPCKKRVYETA